MVERPQRPNVLAPVKVGVVAVAGCFDSAFTSVLDVLRTANSARALVDPHLPEIDVQVLGTSREPVSTGGGLLVPVDAELDDASVDVLVIPALGTNSPEAVGDALIRDDIRALRSRLIRWRADTTTELAAACTGTFVLADAGLLDDRRATTSWWLTGAFTRRFPKVELDMSRMVVRDGHITTAGAAFAHIDLAMSLVSRVSPQLADVTAKTLLIDDRPSRSLESALGYLSSADQLVTDFEAWARANLHRDISVAEAAAAIGTNRRTLERRTRLRLGLTPHAVIRRLRVEQADHLRRTSDLSLAQIANKVGYRHASSLRAAMDPGRS
jgi:transcriptional regulator GlxA family with amidase domain